MGKTKEIEIQREYESINDELQSLKGKIKKDKSNALVKILRAHQKIELLKIPTFIELANDFMHQGFSVVIFVNFTQSLKTLAKLLLTECVIHGEQTSEIRQMNIENFQKNKERLIICNIKAGGVGISLHDISGGHRRVALISPCWSSIDLTQALGRVHRANGKSKSLQRIIYTANTVEEKIAEKIQIKLKELNSINNGDLDLTNIVFEKKPQQM
jgi:superfamily II DNA or RNA helicase